MTKKKARFDAVRELAGTALTTAFAAVGSALGEGVEVLYVFNDCDLPISLSMDSGTTEHFKLAAAESFVIDLRANGMVLDDGSTVQAKAASTPSAGSIRITAVRS